MQSERADTSTHEVRIAVSRSTGPDAAKLREFYAELFGWEIHADNPMNYGLIHIGSTGNSARARTFSPTYMA